jgi:hypothetical protein
MVVEQDVTNNFILNIIRGGKRVPILTSFRHYRSPVDVLGAINKLSKRRIKNGYSLVT